ncbi:MAG: nucleotidyltransferase domain-containing protein [Actinomycetota bacterium]|nr:nucleotidyltransferase domain-containing protein [Actinomycetota bacterium]
MSLIESHTVLSAIVGSRAHGLDLPTSDVDRHGVYAAPTRAFWRLEKPPTSMSGPEPERMNWEVDHYCALALAGKANVLELLVSTEIEVCTPIGTELRALLPAFLSRQIAETYQRAAVSQLHRATSEPLRWKQVMHVIRLLITGRTLLETGTLAIRMDAHRMELLAVRRGEVDLGDCLAWVSRLRSDLAAAASMSALPEEPDRARVEEWLLSVRERGLSD